MENSSPMRVFEDSLDPFSPSQIVDLDLLRTVCSRGIPDQPPWIRPRVWKLLLGSLPPEKAKWATESRKSREKYYNLAIQFLDEIEALPEPALPLTTRDKLIDTIAKDVARTQPRTPFFRSCIDPSPLSPLSPLPRGFVLTKLDDDERSTIPERIESAGALFERVDMIERNLSKKPKAKPSPLSPSDLAEPRSTPEIYATSEPESKELATPEPSNLHSADSSCLRPSTSPSHRPMTPTISVVSPISPSKQQEFSSAVELVSPSVIPAPVPRHSQILLRILYLYSVLHPHQPYTQGLNEVLAPLYLVLCMDLDERESVHAEADAFWLFSELIGEVGEVVGEPGDWRSTSITVPSAPGLGPISGVKGAMAELSARLRWADVQLWEDLCRKSLDPKLPYYSYRWIACLLAQDLPIGSVLTLWDTIFSQPPVSPDSNPRISFLVNICLSMLIRLRHRLINTGNSLARSGGLWDDEYADADQVNASKLGAAPVVNPDGDGVMGEGFVEGMVLLQAYPLKAIGLEMIIRGAWDLHARLEEEQQRRARGPFTAYAIGSSLRERIMNGITNRTAVEDVPEESDEESEGDAATEKEGDLPTPRKIDQAVAKELPNVPSSSVLPSATKIYQYAEALKDSDAAASLSKVSTNLKVAAIDAWSNTAAASSSSQSETGGSVPGSPTKASSSPTPAQLPLPGAPKIRAYMDAFRSSDTAASLSKVSSNWTAAALDRWNKPATSSPLNPTASLPGTSTDHSRSRGGSLSSWSAIGAKAGSLWAGNPGSPRSDASPNWSPSRSDARSSLPIPLQGSNRSSSRQRSETATSSPGYSPPPRPKHFAPPRESMIGVQLNGDLAEPLQHALAKVTRARAESLDSPAEDAASRIGGSILSALATLSGTVAPEPTTPPSPVKAAPRPLLLGTAAAKPSPSRSPRRSPAPDSRPSSLSSNASTSSPMPSPLPIDRSITPTPRTSHSTQASSVRPDSPASVGGRSDAEARLTSGGFVPLRNGVGRPVGSTTIMRKSRAAQSGSMSTDVFDEKPVSPIVASPTSAVQGHVKKYSLTDRPLSTASADGYSSAGSSAGPSPIVAKERVNRLRAKRNYQPRAGALRISVVENGAPDELGLLRHGHGRQVAEDDAGDMSPDTYISPDGGQLRTPQPPQHDGLRTPTSADKEPPRPLRSPRRPKRVPSTGKDREKEPTAVVSEEEGGRADDEDGYGDLLSAYSEDDVEGAQPGRPSVT